MACERSCTWKFFFPLSVGDGYLFCSGSSASKATDFSHVIVEDTVILVAMEALDFNRIRATYENAGDGECENETQAVFFSLVQPQYYNSFPI